MMKDSRRSDNKKLFADFTWIEPDLSYYTSVNKEIDIKMSSTLKQGFAGQSYIAYTLKSPVTEKPAVLYGVPVRDEGKVRSSHHPHRPHRPRLPHDLHRG